MQETISFAEVNIGDKVDVYTSQYRRPRQINWIVKAKPDATGYEGLILKSKGVGDLYLSRQAITKIIRHI